jgi:hypothetical protein
MQAGLTVRVIKPLSYEHSQPTETFPASCVSEGEMLGGRCGSSFC